MTTVTVSLKKIGTTRWRIFSPMGHAISQEFRGNACDAENWARGWISSWKWHLEIERTDDEKEDRILREAVQET